MTFSARGAVSCALLVLLLIPASSAAQSPARGPSVRDLTDASLQDLMNLEVTSVARKGQRIIDTASAVTVISADEIRRSGATSVAELLRRVPGMQVARIDSNKWAISSRGFNGRFADKMLVLVDGRTLYTPLFSGVYWDVQDLLLEDIERIEIVRGPGAALWGANAVNGVINIITKSASETRGGIVAVTAGTEEGAIASVRFGGSAGRDASYRVYGRYFSRSALTSGTGARNEDAWDAGRGGFRLDWQRGADALMFQAEAYDGSSGQLLTREGSMPFYAGTIVDRSTTTGGFALARWTRGLRPGSDLALEIYYDRHARRDSVLEQAINIVDVDFQHHLPIGTRHDLVWGTSARATWDEIGNGPNVGFDPASERLGLFSLFAQDEISVVADKLRVTVGSKLERNHYTGWELQPNARVLLNASARQTIWAAVSRAVRSPSRADTGVMLDTIVFPTEVPGVYLKARLAGNPAFVSETLRSHELGYRVQPDESVSIDAAAFYNVYDDLRSFEPGARTVLQVAPVVVLFQPFTFDNRMQGHSKGIEMAANWDVRSDWRVTGTYAFIDVALRHKPGSTDTIGIVLNDDSPRHMAGIQSRLDLAPTWELDASLSYTGRLRKQSIPGYTRLDVRLAWSPLPQVEFSAVGQNLLDDGHYEFGSTLGEQPGLVRRGLLASARWAF